MGIRRQHALWFAGGVRADIGIYGGPDNWFWGGTVVPDGAVNISSVEDKPQDQGGNVGVVFDASVWDNADLVNNVTSYAVWRHFDPEGGLIDTVSQGSWELVADMPAQSFESYAITAESLGDSTILNGEFNTCFVVVAKTDDDDVSGILMLLAVILLMTLLLYTQLGCLEVIILMMDSA